jgi:A/G-specific adenine glycosylase
MTPAQEAVLAWGGLERRDLPWRRTRDPWAVLVAEVMLAQTQVARVVPRWTAFLDRWPAPAALAADPVSALLAFWQGLGYPRRAANLHRAAGVIVEQHHGAVPAALDDLLALPGIGRYTARAVLAFAFEQQVGVVDTNIARVLARHAGTRLTTAAAQRAADAWVPSGRSWEWNQTLMDLGARHCRPVPDCERCPLAASCAWAGSGWTSPDPAERSAGVSRPQARYEGSDRQARGRLLRRLAGGPLDAAAVADAAGCPGEPARGARLAESLVADGLAHRACGNLLLGPSA